MPSLDLRGRPGSLPPDAEPVQAELVQADPVQADVAVADDDLPAAAGHRLVVRDVVEETPDARSLVFDVPAEQAERFRYTPGQFLTVRMPGEDGDAAARCYSLSSAPGIDPHLTVTVKRVDGGRVSHWICNDVRPGQEIDVLPPSGRFTPRSLDADLLLVAGGSGITPVMSIARSVLERGTGTVVLVYANRDEHSVIFADRLRELGERHPERLLVLHLLESVEGRPTAARLRAVLGPHTGRDGAFVCGPGPFMEAAGATLRELGMTRERVVVEKFVSLSTDPFSRTRAAPAPDADAGAADAGAARVRVTLDGEQHELSWPRNRHLLDVLLDAGLDAPFSCREGACSACSCKIVSGEVTMTRNDVLEDEDLEEGWVLGCQSLPVADHVDVSYDDE